MSFYDDPFSVTIHFIFLELLISLSLQPVTLNHKLATIFSGNDIYVK